jgi:ABC-type transport system involved in multi-copper enzyme maturation permease subunit
MTGLIRAELLHLRSLRSTSITAVAIVALGTLIVYADFSDAGTGGMKTSKDLLDAFVSTMSLTSAIGLALFAAARSAAEFRYGTIAHRALAAPRRRDLVAAKLAGIVVFSAVVSGVTVAAGALAALAATSAGDPQLHLSVSSIAELVTGSTLFACLGLAVGFLARNQTAAVLVVFGGWVFEKLLMALTESAAFMPYALLGALAQDEVLAGLGLAALTAAALAAAATLLTRKDVI